jgi:hypothetical protein
MAIRGVEKGQSGAPRGMRPSSACNSWSIAELSVASPSPVAWQGTAAPAGTSFSGIPGQVL